MLRVQAMRGRMMVRNSPLLCFATMSMASNAAAMSLHNLEGKAIDKSALSMNSFAGKPVLVVNVASR